MLKLQYRATTAIPVEAECVTPANLAGKSSAQVAALPVQHGNVPAPLGEFFSVEADAADGEMLMRRRNGQRVAGSVSAATWFRSAREKC